MKPDLYNDLHPNTSLKNTGFKDKDKAINTINLVKYRSLRYQFDVINTMYYRAKFFRYTNQNIKEAMKIFKLWLNKYKLNKIIQDNKYKWISIDQINNYYNLINKYNIPDKYIDFYKKYKKYNKHKLQYILYENNTKYDYYSYRIKLIDNILPKIINKNKFSKYHLILILLAYKL